MNITFTKMQAYGNDYIYIDAIHQEITEPNELAKKIADRHFGIGADGMVLICSSTHCDFRMRMFNPDGTEGEMCGNALRSLSMLVYEEELTDQTKLTIETLGGIQKIDLIVEEGEVVNIKANIGKPQLAAQMIPVNTSKKVFFNERIYILGMEFYIFSLSWGNPHSVIFVENVDTFDVERYGKAIEHNLELFPKKTNVTFAQIINSHYIKIREWERGTGETLGCGTGCCSAAVIAHLIGKCDKSVEVEQIGGILHVDWEETGEVSMLGPSCVICKGEYYYETE